MTDTLQIATFTDPQFGENGYLLWRHSGGPCWIVDPGLPPSGEHMLAGIRRENLTLDALILTHGHLDHIAGVPVILTAHPSIPVYIAKEAAPALTDPNENLSAGYGVPIVVGELKTRDLPAGGSLTLGGLSWQIFDTSGHAPGSRSLYCAEAGVVIVGDALFFRSIGRTDFHHSDPATYLRNIREH